MRDHLARLAERNALELKLQQAGFVVDGGGLSLVDDHFDIFVIDPVTSEYLGVLSSAKAVDEFIRFGGIRVSVH